MRNPKNPTSFGIAPDGTPWRSLAHALSRLGMGAATFWDLHKEGEIGEVYKPSERRTLISEKTITDYISAHIVRHFETEDPSPWKDEGGPNAHPGSRASA